MAEPIVELFRKAWPGDSRRASEDHVNTRLNWFVGLFLRAIGHVLFVALSALAGWVFRMMFE